MSPTSVLPNAAKISLVLGLLSVVGPMSIDMYLPALPSIAEGLNSSIGSVQGTLTAYLLGIGIAQIFYGPVSDQFGRKGPLFLGLTLFIIGSAISYLATTIEVLTAARLLQGLGGAAVMVIPRAIVRDMDTGVAAARLMGTIMMVISVSPMIAPLIGSGMMLFGGWRAIFLAFVILGVVSIAIVQFALPESLEADDRVPFNAGTFWAGIKTLVSDPLYMGLTFIGAFGMASFFVFFASASFVYTSEFGLSPVQFSLAFAVNGLGFFIATKFIGTVAAKFGLPTVIKTAVAVFTVLTVALAAIVSSGVVSLWIIMALLFFGFGALGLVVPPTMVLALDNHGKIAGLASSFGGTLQVLTAGAMIALSEPFFDGTSLPMVTVIALCAIVAFALSRLTLRKQAAEQPA